MFPCTPMEVFTHFILLLGRESLFSRRQRDGCAMSCPKLQFQHLVGVINLHKSSPPLLNPRPSSAGDVSGATILQRCFTSMKHTREDFTMTHKNRGESSHVIDFRQLTTRSSDSDSRRKLARSGFIRNSKSAELKSQVKIRLMTVRCLKRSIVWRLMIQFAVPRL